MAEEEEEEEEEDENKRIRPRERALGQKKEKLRHPARLCPNLIFWHQFAIPRLISVFENANAMTNSKLNTFMILSKNKELDEFGRKEKTMVWRKKIDRSF